MLIWVLLLWPFLIQQTLPLSNSLCTNSLSSSLQFNQMLWRHRVQIQRKQALETVPNLVSVPLALHVPWWTPLSLYGKVQTASSTEVPRRVVFPKEPLHWRMLGNNIWSSVLFFAALTAVSPQIHQQPATHGPEGKCVATRWRRPSRNPFVCFHLQRFIFFWEFGPSTLLFPCAQRHFLWFFTGGVLSRNEIPRLGVFLRYIPENLPVPWRVVFSPLFCLMFPTQSEETQLAGPPLQILVSLMVELTGVVVFQKFFKTVLHGFQAISPFFFDSVRYFSMFCQKTFFVRKQNQLRPLPRRGLFRNSVLKYQKISRRIENTMVKSFREILFRTPKAVLLTWPHRYQNIRSRTCTNFPRHCAFPHFSGTVQIETLRSALSLTAICIEEILFWLR